MHPPDEVPTAIVPRTRMPTLAELMNPAPPSPDKGLSQKQSISKPTAVLNRPNGESSAPKKSGNRRKDSIKATELMRDGKHFGAVEGFKHGGDSLQTRRVPPPLFLSGMASQLSAPSYR
ncbi:unnamed protein product [Cyclocybe aegerita]|uniref:Uncharacterized protein n=1 Tax=Cyclocybe aegerita TaxID=1973307 RepID=A0A8S0WT73_CYCAE|nr:unnamed protein product [Cyclocybe aegerita]